MQLGLISPASQAALFLCLCLLGCLPFLAPVSPEKGGFLACVPRLGVCCLLFLNQDPSTVIDNGEESQDGAGNDGGKRRKRKPSRHGGKEKEAERIG